MMDPASLTLDPLFRMRTKPKSMGVFLCIYSDIEYTYTFACTSIHLSTHICLTVSFVHSTSTCCPNG
jgi:hypothetical protein